MEKFKKISKYILNILTIINALIIGIAPIWNINADKVTNTIAVVIAVISTYLLVFGLAAPIAGWVSDRIGNRKQFVLSFSISS